MTKSPNPEAESRPSSEPRRRTEHQDTVLLGETPDVAFEAPPVRPPILTAAQLTSLALAPLTERYDILGEAGHGSMGNVYKARDRETGETVALKLLKPEIASDQVMMERFKNELLFARKITHKNVCRVYEFNRIGGIAYTSMEFVEGESLRSVLNRFGGLPPRKAFDLILQICSGLTEAHAQGIVHRDLKPENVMIDARGNVKIMDFGIARSMETLTRLTGSMVGTPAYMAPEQVGGKPIDYRTDIYALGLIMYEVFTGTPAFQAENTVAVALKQMNEAPIPPHEIDPTVPAAVERAILKCLEKEPAKRFQSIAEVERGLRSPGADQASIPFHPSGRRPTPGRVRQQTPTVAADATAKRTSPLVWLLLGAGLVLLTLGGLRAAQLQRLAQTLTLGASLRAPAPPDFALTFPAVRVARAEPLAATRDASPTEETAAAPEPAVEPAAPTARPPKPRRADRATGSETANDPGRAKIETQSPARAPTPAVASALPQRASQAWHYAEPAAAGNANYVWVGRFEVEDRAHGTAKKIEDLGLPTTIIPRHTDKGDFFVVVTGPFAEKRMPSVLQWLQTQGFANARPIGGQPAGSHQNQGSHP
jgi:hypothetical protein